METTGKVIRRRIALGSKSERDAVMLSTASGDFVLRRMGGDPYHDPELEDLVGRTVKTLGEIAGGNTFLARQIAEIEPKTGE